METTAQIGAAMMAALAVPIAVLAALAWPRGRQTDHFELLIDAPPQTVWDTYFAHVKKANYRPGTRIIDAEILGEAPLTVRLTVQHDISSAPRQVVFTYDLYEPYNRYRLHDDASALVDEGEFAPVAGGTRLQVAITTRPHGFILPLLSRRRVERAQRALKDVCEGREVSLSRGPLPQAGNWETWVILLLVASLFLRVPWPLQLALGLAGCFVALLCVRRFLVLARRL